jgi:molybdopterin-guanine dinucleotide biosynthesis protein B
MRIVAVVGFSESGKTRLVVRLIRELKGRGLRVGAVKRCSHGFTLDTEGKDTAEFSAAGADGVAMVAPDGWAALGRAPEPDAARLARRLFPRADVVLIEGGKEIRGTPKIEIRREGVPDIPAVAPEELIAIVSDVPVPGAAAPVLGPDDIPGVADVILRQKEGDMTEIKLEVDGREVDLNAFVQSFIEKTVVGMVTALSGIDPEPREIRLEIVRKPAPAGGGAKP